MPKVDEDGEMMSDDPQGAEETAGGEVNPAETQDPHESMGGGQSGG